MNKFGKSGMTGFMLLLLAGQVAAATDGFYAGLAGGYSDYSAGGPPRESFFQPGQEFSGGDNTYGLHLGYQFTPWFGLELGYEDYGSASHTFRLKGNVDFIIPPNDTQTIKTHGVQLSGVFAYELTPSVSAFGRLGVASLKFKSTLSGGFSEASGSLLGMNASSDQGLVYVIGAKYRLTDSLSADVELRRTDIGDLKLTTTNVGVDYRF